MSSYCYWYGLNGETRLVIEGMLDAKTSRSTSTEAVSGHNYISHLMRRLLRWLTSMVWHVL
jgi:hypothetical protein